MDEAAPQAGGGLAAEEATVGAVRRLEERLARDPGSLAFAPLADAYRKAGRLADAVRLCRDGLERFPHYTTARLILAKAYLDGGETDLARGEVRAILDAKPREDEAHRLAAEIDRRAGRLDDAVAHLEQVVRLDPADREARAALDVLRGQLGEHSPLAGVLANDTFINMGFGALCLEQGLIEEAAHVFRRLLQKNPGDLGASERLEQALRAKTQRRKGT